MSYGLSQNTLVRCVFASAVQHAVGEQELPGILLDYGRIARQKNITGMVLCEGRDVFQVFEGSRQEIDDLYQQVDLDRRQHRVVKLLDEKLSERDFATMSLAYGIAGRRVFRQLDDNQEVFARPGPVHTLPESKAKALILQFANRRWRQS